MDFQLQETIALLERTPRALDALLRGLPDSWTRSNEGESTWSAADIVAHLCHAEREDWMPRARILLQHGETEPFPPFDRWGYIVDSRGLPVAALLDEFAHMRTNSLAELSTLNLTEADLARRGRHPALGTVTLNDLLATWAAHDLNHLHQMARVMARQYQHATGPFSRFMGVMQCAAHGA